MIDLEREKKNFQNHVATFTDYGNIKILDFQRPDSNEYRIRFLFEEDHYRLHISGDLGELIASNYKNMVFELFEEHFADNTGYFSEKIDCMSRSICYYDEEQAEKDIMEYLEEDEYLEEMQDGGVDIELWISNVLTDFAEECGIQGRGYNELSEYVYEANECVRDFGKVNTGILDLYMLAFKLAMKQLRERNEL